MQEDQTINSTNLDEIVREISPDPEVRWQDIARQYTERIHGSITERHKITDTEADAEKFYKTAVRADDRIQLLTSMLQVFHPSFTHRRRHVC